MAISSEHIGRSYPSTSVYEVNAEKIAEFATALGDDNPAYFGDDPVAPPTFPAVIASKAWGPFFDDPDLGLALHRTIHADQRFDYERPLRAGDRVSAKLTITKVRNRGNVNMVTIDVEISDEQGKRVVTATSQLIHTAEEQH